MVEKGTSREAGGTPAHDGDVASQPTSRATQMRAALLGQRRRLLGQVAQVEDDLRWLDANVEPERTEEGQERALAAVLARLDEHDRAELHAIDRALMRIRRGEHERCAVCGEEIPLARQQALPTAHLCRPCAEDRDAPENF